MRYLPVLLLACVNTACSSSNPPQAETPDSSNTAETSGETAPDGDTVHDSAVDVVDSSTAETTAMDSMPETTETPFTDYIPATESFAGKDYAAWSAAWFQWLFAIPAATTPTDGGDCKQGQSGDVWFLAGTTSMTATMRDCTIPAGKTLLFPLANSVCFPCHEDEGCSTPKTEAELAACTKLGTATTLGVKIDGHPITADLQAFHVLSKQFSFKGPTSGDGVLGACTGPIPANTCGIPVGDRYGVADGYWMAVRPLSKGTHVLSFKSVIPMTGSPVLQDVTYHLVIE